MGGRSGITSVPFALLAVACSSSNTPSASNEATAPPQNDASVAIEEPDAATPVARACYLDENAARKAPLSSGFRAPTQKFLGKCNKATINNLLECTHKSDADAPNDPACLALKPEKACIACIFNERGAILDVKFPNTAGCVALAMGDTSSNGCGRAYEDWLSCQKAGCASCIGATGAEKEPGALRECAQEAVNVVCNERADFDRCQGLEEKADYQAYCKAPTPLDDAYLGRLYNYFCGTEGAF